MISVPTTLSHYSENHGTLNKPPLHEAYTVTFVEQPSCHSLDICENKWYHLIDAQINTQNMILPHVNYYDALCCLTQSDVVFHFVHQLFSQHSLLTPTVAFKVNSWQVKMRTPETYCPHMAYYFSLQLLVISPRVSF